MHGGGQGLAISFIGATTLPSGQLASHARRLAMPLQRGEVQGYNFNRMAVEFTMVNQGKVVPCSISTAAMDDLEGATCAAPLTRRAPRIVRPELARGHDQSAIRTLSEIRNGTLDFPGIPQVDRAQLHADRSGSLDRGKLADTGGDGRIAQRRHALHAGCDLLEQLEPFRSQRILEDDKAGNVAARSRHTSD